MMMKWKDRSRGLLKTASLLAGVGALTVTMATPAGAHAIRVYEGSDYAGAGADHRWTEVCDIERDGNGVYAYYLVRGLTGLVKVGDANGSAGGCGNRTFNGDVLNVTVCETTDVGNDICEGKNHN